MRYDRFKHHRRSVRPQKWDYSSVGPYYVTILTKRMESIFGHIKNGNMILNDIGKIAHRYWYSLPEKYDMIDLDEFQIMPNHLHGVVIIKKRITPPVREIHEFPLREGMSMRPANFQFSLDSTKDPFIAWRNYRRRMLLFKIMGFYKMNSAKEINIVRNTKGANVWHRSFHDEIIRNPKHFQNVRKYIRNNPKNWDKDENNPVNIKKSRKRK